MSRARELRKNLTEAEKRLWSVLRYEQMGVRFRRQVPIGPYIVDFACFDRGLIIEADGGQHADSAHDARRDAWLISQGFTVLRFWNNDILTNVEGVRHQIAAALDTLPPRGGGRGPRP